MIKTEYDYYPAGQLKTSYVFENGALVALSGFYESGQLWEQAHFKNGREDGITTVYDEYVNLRAEWCYRNGLLNGVSRKYYADGMLWEKMLYVDDNTIWKKEYDRRGVLKSETVFEGEAEVKRYSH